MHDDDYAWLAAEAQYIQERDMEEAYWRDVQQEWYALMCMDQEYTDRNQDRLAIVEAAD